MINIDLALDYYGRAAKLYSDVEVSRGWRGDAYRMIGKLTLEKAKKLSSGGELTKAVAAARESLTKAREDYTAAIPESRNYNSPRLTEVSDLLVEISKDKENPVAGKVTTNQSK